MNKGSIGNTESWEGAHPFFDSPHYGMEELPNLNRSHDVAWYKYGERFLYLNRSSKSVVTSVHTTLLKSTAIEITTKFSVTLP